MALRPRSPIRFVIICYQRLYLNELLLALDDTYVHLQIPRKARNLRLVGDHAANQGHDHLLERFHGNLQWKDTPAPNKNFLRGVVFQTCHTLLLLRYRPFLDGGQSACSWRGTFLAEVPLPFAERTRQSFRSSWCARSTVQRGSPHVARRTLSKGK